MFNSPTRKELQTPIRPPMTTSDLLISFDTPAQEPTNVNAPATIRKTLLDLDVDDLSLPTPKSRAKYNDKALSEFISSALDAERERWTQEVNMRHAVEMEALAADLHSQYREKHTRKVEALKLTYKKQYEKKITTLEDKVNELESSIEELKAELKKEVQEKRELIEMSEELMRLTSAGNQE